LRDFNVIGIPILSGKAISYIINRWKCQLRLLAMVVKPEVYKK